ncbi:hypothetical protein TorRG33x02_063130 [Trema orientale]|uniref:Uncharacterized protein n=1 Tax=Trema orientale TaxID=63057 RepID=A0A2P5FJM3_TREOI|nr:hypothetical protein TorRG33x02_063130 [Trema orientale]
MHDDETMSGFHARICDVANESYALGEIYSDAKLVRNVQCSIPKWFKAKVTSIEEYRDVEILDLDELIRSLQICEINLQRWNKDKLATSLSLKHIQSVDQFSTE